MCGDPGRQFAKFSRQLLALHKKTGPFDFVLLLRPPAGLPADFPFPLPAYFAADEYESSSQPRKVRHNLFYVGACGNRVVGGVNFVLLAAGVDGSRMSPAVERALHRAGANDDDFRGVDILATGDLPRGVAGGDADAGASALAGEVAMRTRPRRHFAGAWRSFALKEFVCKGARHGTEFVAVAGYEARRRSGEAERWMCAVDIKPLASMTVGQREATVRRKGRAPYVGIEEGDNECGVEESSFATTREDMDASASRNVREV